MASILGRAWLRMKKQAPLTASAPQADGFLISYPKSGRTGFARFSIDAASGG
ncbi:hypothetical protein [Sinorhizobium glycinis]|uniref:hypothetical protein n=1 Tax=Sinorhizobium glycinis TaxID=1472378 RepID=UPI000A57ED57|nr:hypothetical protein [Sinorhizobium glycinis]